MYPGAEGFGLGIKGVAGYRGVWVRDEGWSDPGTEECRLGIKGVAGYRGVWVRD